MYSPGVGVSVAARATRTLTGVAFVLTILRLRYETVEPGTVYTVVKVAAARED
jgi:hypothetical protein